MPQDNHAARGSEGPMPRVVGPHPSKRRVGFRSVWLGAVTKTSKPTRRFDGWVFGYFTSSITLSECALNSGAYMHCTFANPVGYCPLCCTRTAYSNTYTPFGR